LKNIEKKIIVIIPARNETEFLDNTLDALKKQIHSPHRIILVNDGSTDDTSEIAKKFHTEVFDLDDRGFRATGEPVLANVINKGLDNIFENECEYIMILGADHVIPPNYISEIIAIMEKDNLLVIASGVIKGEFQSNNSPRGSGRIIKYDFWKKLGLRYPSWYGFETYVVYKALVNCYKVQVVKEMVSWSQRPTGTTTNYKSYGKAMRALGYHPVYALGRIILTFKHTINGAIKMALGYLDLSVKKYDIAPDVHKLQSKQLRKKLSL